VKYLCADRLNVAICCVRDNGCVFFGVIIVSFEIAASRLAYRLTAS